MRPDLDPDLEALSPEGWDGPPPRLAQPSVAARTRRLRPTPKLVGLFAGVLAAGAALAVYTSVAVAGVRALERDRAAADILDEERAATTNRVLAAVVNEEDLSISIDAMRGLMKEHRTRLLALAHHAAKVRAVDSSVRNARQAVVGALQRDAHDLGHLIDAPRPPTIVSLGRGLPYADRTLADARRRWHLDPVEQHVHPARLKAADAALDRLRRWSDEEVGVRLFLVGADGMRVFDVDRRTQEPFSNVLGFGAVLGRGFMADVEMDHMVAVDLRTGNRLPDVPTDGADMRLVPSADGNALWVQAQPGGPVVERDVSGRAVGGSVAGHGTLLADLGDVLLWNYAVLAPDVIMDVPVHVVLTDKTGRVLRRLEVDWFLAASSTALAWRDGETLRVTDLAGKPLDVPQVPGSIPTAATFSPDGRRLAVLWQPSGPGRLQVIDLGSGLSTGPVPADVAEGSMKWSSDGKLLFFKNGARYGYLRPYESRVHMLRLRYPGELVAAVAP